MFYRKIQSVLEEYYIDKSEPILVINGARQIGKSFIIRETAQKKFKNYIEINLQDDKNGNRLFEKVNNTESFYLIVSSLYGDRLNNNEDTIVFLDEIQAYPHLISLLKPLRAENRYRYIASGSLLGITLKHIFIPMGSIKEVRMYPMDFEEFLYANDVGKDVINYLKKCFNDRSSISESIHAVILRKFKEYLITGGLPDSIKAFITTKNMYKLRQIQTSIFNYYKDDASQYDINNSLVVRKIYDSMLSYMANKVKRLQYKKIEDIKDANYVRYNDEFEYLINSGCAINAKAISNPIFPLQETMSKNLIKLYYNDVGILSNLLYKNNIDAILNSDKNINLGSVYETVCAMELIAHGHDLYYFDSKKVGEVDFLINDYDNLDALPIEIKSGKDMNNFRAIPKLLKDPYNLKTGYIFNNSNEIIIKDNLVKYPIYLIMFV